MQKSLSKTLLCLAVTSAYTLPLQAVEIDWSGFMSIVGGQTLSSGDTYSVGSVGQDDIVYGDTISFIPDSLLALQGQVSIADDLRATVQIVGRGSEKMDAQLEWAYLSYDVSENLTLNAGRYRLPLYYYSDFIDVGYAYYWVRPPTELYSGPTTLNGVNAYYSKSTRTFDYSAQVWLGNDSYNANGILGPGIETINVNDGYGANFMVTYDWLSFRSVYYKTDVEIPNAFTFGLEQMGFAVMVDYNDFMWRSELTRLDSEVDGRGFTNAWYVSAGYRFGDFTPHVTYVDSERDFVEVITVGVSYDATPKAKIKVEVSDREGTVDPDVDTQLLTFGVDLIF